MNLRYVKGLKVEKMSGVSNIQHHIKDPMDYPKVQGGYEGLAQVIFSTQMDNLLIDLTKEMVKLKSKL